MGRPRIAKEEKKRIKDEGRTKSRHGGALRSHVLLVVSQKPSPMDEVPTQTHPIAKIEVHKEETSMDKV